MPNTRYWAYRGFEEKALQNGSFIRVNSRGEYDKYSNGLYVGSIDEINPDQFTAVSTELALKLLPRSLVKSYLYEEVQSPEFTAALMTGMPQTA